jgi:F0F1-type ATP synthase membrane subunit b/b'
MTNQALAEIVAVEKEIQARLAEERRKAATWLAEERERIGKEVERELAEAQREFRQAIAAAEVEAGNEIKTLLQQAEEYATRLKNLPDQDLRERIAAHLTRLLPEEEP